MECGLWSVVCAAPFRLYVPPPPRPRPAARARGARPLGYPLGLAARARACVWVWARARDLCPGPRAAIASVSDCLSRRTQVHVNNKLAIGGFYCKYRSRFPAKLPYRVPSRPLTSECRVWSYWNCLCPCRCCCWVLPGARSRSSRVSYRCYCFITLKAEPRSSPPPPPPPPPLLFRLRENGVFGENGVPLGFGCPWAASS